MAHGLTTAGGAVRRTGFMERRGPLLRLCTRQLHHLAPFLGVVGDEFAEVGGRAGQRHAAEASRAFMLGSARAALISLVSLSSACSWARRGRTSHKTKGRRTASFSSAPLSLPWVSPHTEGQPSLKLRT